MVMWIYALQLITRQSQWMNGKKATHFHKLIFFSLYGLISGGKLHTISSVYIFLMQIILPLMYNESRSFVCITNLFISCTTSMTSRKSKESFFPMKSLHLPKIIAWKIHFIISHLFISAQKQSSWWCNGSSKRARDYCSVLEGKEWCKKQIAMDENNIKLDYVCTIVASTMFSSFSVCVCVHVNVLCK